MLLRKDNKTKSICGGYNGNDKHGKNKIHRRHHDLLARHRCLCVPKANVSSLYIFFVVIIFGEICLL